MSTAVANKLNHLNDYLVAKIPSLSSVAPQGADVRRIVRLAIFEASKNEKLRDCTPQSIYVALGKACQLNLVAGGSLHRASLVPIWNKDKGAMEAALWVEYTGLMQLARQSGQVASFVAHVVYDNEEFEHYTSLADGEVLIHHPDYTQKPGALHLAYAIVTLTDGSKQVEVMRKDEIENIRKGSRMGNFGPWKNHTSEMWRKTVIKRICKYLPLTPAAQEVIAHDNSSHTGENRDAFVPDVVLAEVRREEAEARPAIDVDSRPASASRAARVVSPPEPAAEESATTPVDNPAGPASQTDFT